ncbi:methyltransferase family protein [Horticoccus sp. 23ND18S-11]|uniref:methyltransferase family protein n=1 Tax=Horticoccus sp. 23ND18S-11 TaxID=3391832 RepID=UPI0039C96B7D
MKLHLRLPPLALTAIAAGLGWVIARALPAFALELPARYGVAGACGALGLACSILGVAAFRRARTTVNPLTPAATTALVVSGVYRITRNPMYLGFLGVLLAEIAWLANPAALLVAGGFVLYLNRYQIAPEEHALRARFGPAYLSYAARVRRWI